MKILFKISSIILLMIIVGNKLSKEENIPKFCETPQIDGIYNFGHHIMLRYNEWLWIYDETSMTIIEPPQKEPLNKFQENLRVLTTLFISKVKIFSGGSCPPQWNKDYCDRQYRALDLLFIRLFDKITHKEFTFVTRFTANGNLTNVRADEFPWNLKFDANCWPKEWENDFYNKRPSAFWPNTLQSFFISHSGDTNLSQILYNEITSNDWYENLKRDPLKSNVKFVGIFYLNFKQMLFSVGNRKGDPMSRMYALKLSNNKRFYFEDINIEMRSFFGCKFPTTTTTHTITLNPSKPMETKTTKQIFSEEESKDDEESQVIATIVIVVIALVLVFAFIVIIIIFVVIRMKGRVTTTQSMQSSEIGNSSFMDKTSSVVTINSESGLRVKPTYLK